MAEARRGVHPIPGLQRAGFEIDTNIKKFQAFVGRPGIVLYIPHPRFLIRGAKRTIWRAANKLSIAFMPLNTVGILATTTAITAKAIAADSASWLRSGWLAEALWKLDAHNPLAERIPVKIRIGYLAAGASIAGLFVFASAERFLLRRLLSYQDWLERAKQNTIKTKLWGVTMRLLFLGRISGSLYAYQHCLPTLPLPNVQDTCMRYLETVEPLLSPEELTQHKAEAAEFLAKDAAALQRRLFLVWLTSSNYISGWWLDFVYLRARDSLPINSNWYGLGFSEYRPTNSQAARAAHMTYTFVRSARTLFNGTFEPQLINGVAPLCMAQYEYAFAVTRVPGPEQDHLQKYDPSESRHVAVIHNGNLYKLPVFSPKSMQQLSPLQLLKAYQGILDARSLPEGAEPKSANIPALTTLNRTKWAELREKYFVTDPHNASRLEAIESALFVVCLDDVKPQSWSEEGFNIMCGNGANRWADKSFNLTVTKNALAGLHAEHSWGDAPSLAHILEVTMIAEGALEFYNPDGTIKPTHADEAKMKSGPLQVYPAERLDFLVDEELESEALEAKLLMQKNGADFDLFVEGFYSFGKKKIGRSAKASPDAFIQMALQLAYFRDQGHFDLTYESSTTRLFLNGRTETIRSLSKQSVAFVEAMVALLEKSATATEEDRKGVAKLMRAACEQHQHYTHDTMRGNGVDRHLFALYVVSVGINRPSAFLKAALGRKWKLSTSQVSPVQCSPKERARILCDELYCPNGGFGPVADDGYGVCYNVWDDRLYFNISAKKQYENTDPRRFFKAVSQALNDMMGLFEQ